MKALTLSSMLAVLFLVGCAADKSSEIQTVSSPPAKSQTPTGVPSNIPPAAQKAMGK